jgi:hypothetical protein
VLPQEWGEAQPPEILTQMFNNSVLLLPESTAGVR